MLTNAGIKIAIDLILSEFWTNSATKYLPGQVGRGGLSWTPDSVHPTVEKWCQNQLLEGPQTEWIVNQPRNMNNCCMQSLLEMSKPLAKFLVKVLYILILFPKHKRAHAPIYKHTFKFPIYV